MTMVVTLPDCNAREHAAWERLLRRFHAKLRLWARRRHGLC